MTRTVTDAGSRYEITVPLSRDLSDAERESLAAALEAAAFKHASRRDETIDTRDVVVTDQEARILVGLPVREPRGPADVAGRLAAAMTQWQHGREPYGRGVRAGRPAVATADATAFQSDRAATSDELHTAVLWIPERPLTEQEQAVLSARLDAPVVICESCLGIFDAINHANATPQRTGGQFKRVVRLNPALDNSLLDRSFWPRVEAGTVATVDQQTREIVQARAAELAPTPEPTGPTQTARTSR